MATGNPSSQPVVAAAATKPNVLIVEDDATSAGALKSILTRKGCEVRTATMLLDGIQLLEGRPDYVILDLMLPDGSGVELLRRVAAEGDCSPRVIVTTALADPIRLEEVRSLHPYRLLRKPIDLVDLLRAIGMM